MIKKNTAREEEFHDHCSGRGKESRDGTSWCSSPKEKLDAAIALALKFSH
jgi:hypothetical protein